MRKSLSLILAALGAVAVSHVQAAGVISDWTFETSQPVGTNSGAFGAFAAEVGSGTASAFHSSVSPVPVYSTPAGNGSPHSFSANTWSVGDFYQFSVSAASIPGATSFANITIGFDQISSATGPKNFTFSYSTDGSIFTSFATYSAITNAGLTVWGSGTAVPTSHVSEDLTLVDALNGASSLTFRVVDNSTTAENGTTVATGGTDRIDNFTITADVIPEPSTMALMGLGGVAGSCFLARRRR